MEGRFRHWLKHFKKGYCDFLSHNSDFISQLRVKVKYCGGKKTDMFSELRVKCHNSDFSNLQLSLYLTILRKKVRIVISVGSCNTEDCSNDAENSGLPTIKLRFKMYSNRKQVILNYKNISQYYCFCCIFYQINETLVSSRDFLLKQILADLKLLSGSAHMWPWTRSKFRFIYNLKAEWINFPLTYGLLWQDNIWPRYNYLKIWNLRVQKNTNVEKISFKVDQVKFLAMRITNQKLCFDIFTVGNVQNIFIEHDIYFSFEFCHKRKNYNFDPYNVFLRSVLWSRVTYIQLYSCTLPLKLFMEVN